MRDIDRYGPWAIVAGASEGTGRAFARQIAARGIKCVLVARRRAPLEALADEINAEFGVECSTAAINLAEAGASEQLVAAAGSRDVGLFVANAGADPYGAGLLDRPMSEWSALIRRNVMTVAEACHHFAGTMKARGRGGIILVNSGACYGGANRMAIYSATKAFELCLGESLWSELKPHGVHVLNLVLGATDTPEFRRFLAARGAPLPANVADASAAAALGLRHLADGPVCNWAKEADEAPFGATSAADRRRRIELINEFSRPLFERGGG